MSSDIELEIGAGSAPNEFIARVLRAASGGEPTAVIRLDVDHLLRSRGTLEALVLASAVSARRILPASEQQLRLVGQHLFDSLFSGTVYGAYRASVAVAQQRGEALRVVLRLTAPELAALPWEALFDTETNTYVCRKEPLVRHVPAPYTPDPLDVVPPLRVLGLVASPRGMPILDVAAEQRHLTEALAGPVAEGLIDLQWLAQATWDGVHEKLLSGSWHVVHFIGHGDYSVESDQGLIALVGRDGRAEMVEAEKLADLLGEAQPTPRLVVLNSCSSGESGTQDIFSGTAAALVRSGISAVAAMQFTVSDAAAIAFSRGFYTAIAHGRGIDEATRSGRISILGAPHTLEWVTPVLYLRGDTARLFELGDPERTAAKGAQAAAPGQPSPGNAQLHAMYLEARAELRAKHYATASELLAELRQLAPDYRDSAQLRDAAEKQLDLAHRYERATQFEESGDWAAAGQLYAEITVIEPTYRDVAARQAACSTRQRAADLEAELRYQVDAGNWQAAIEVSDELVSIDPSYADPDGLTALAHESLREVAESAELERRYSEARAAEDNGNWPRAHHLYNAILREDPQYRDVRARFESCHARIELYMTLGADLKQLRTKRRRIHELRTQIDDRRTQGHKVDVEEMDLVRLKIAELKRLDPAEAESYTTIDERAAQWLAQHPEPLRTIEPSRWMRSVSWDRSGTHLAVGGDDGRVRVYDEAGKQLLNIKAARWFAFAWSVALNPDGTTLAAGNAQGRCRVWDVATGQERFSVQHSDKVTSIAFSPDGKNFATGSDDCMVRIWGALTGNKLRQFRHSASITSVAYNRLGTRLAIASVDKRAWIAELNSHTRLEGFRHSEPVSSVAFSPDGRWLATGSFDQTACVWDASTAAQLLELRHAGRVTSVGFSPDGTRLVTGCEDQTARVWDAVTGEQQLELRHGDEVLSVGFKPDGTVVASAGKGGLRIWPAAKAGGGHRNRAE